MLRSGVTIWPAFSLRINLRDLPLVLAAGAVLIAAEVYLSHRKERWLWLILPGVWFLGTLADLISQAVRGWGTGRMGDVWEAAAAALVIENLPTLILLAVCGACRLLRRRNLRRQLRKTQVDDL